MECTQQAKEPVCGTTLFNVPNSNPIFSSNNTERYEMAEKFVAATERCPLYKEVTIWNYVAWNMNRWLTHERPDWPLHRGSKHCMQKYNKLLTHALHECSATLWMSGIYCTREITALSDCMCNVRFYPLLWRPWTEKALVCKYQHSRKWAMRLSRYIYALHECHRPAQL